MWKSTSELGYLRKARRVDGVGRPKFDFHTGLEAIFNLVLAWSALFAGFAADGRRGRPQGSMLPTLLGMQFLTNAFFLPYLATVSYTHLTLPTKLEV